MKIELFDCIHIPSEEYANLIDPKFEGQTPLNSKGELYMVFSSEGKLYALKYNMLRRKNVIPLG